MSLHTQLSELNMSPVPPHQDRAERRDRALALRRKIRAPRVACRAVRKRRPEVEPGASFGVISKTTTTTLSPGESRVSSTILTCRRHARSGLLDNYPPVTVTALAAVPAASSPTVMTVGARMSASDAMS
jgi:hypothetical protein